MIDTARPGMPPVVTLIAAEGGGRAMLMELGVMEQRYHAVIEVISAARFERRSHGNLFGSSESH